MLKKLKELIQKRKKNKEIKLVNKAKLNRDEKYITKSMLKKKLQNSQSFTNIKDISDNGVITLKTNQLAIFYKVSPIDLSLTNKNEQELFFHTLSKLYRLPFTIRPINLMKKLILI